MFTEILTQIVLGLSIGAGVGTMNVFVKPLFQERQTAAAVSRKAVAHAAGD